LRGGFFPLPPPCHRLHSLVFFPLTFDGWESPDLFPPPELEVKGSGRKYKIVNSSLSPPVDLRVGFSLIVWIGRVRLIFDSFPPSNRWGRQPRRKSQVKEDPFPTAVITKLGFPSFSFHSKMVSPVLLFPHTLGFHKALSFTFQRTKTRFPFPPFPPFSFFSFPFQLATRCTNAPPLFFSFFFPFFPWIDLVRS